MKKIILIFWFFLLLVSPIFAETTVEGKVAGYSISGNTNLITLRLVDDSKMDFYVNENSVFEGRNSIREVKVFDLATVTYTTENNRNYALHLKIVPKVSKPAKQVIPTHEVFHISEDDPAVLELRKRMESDPRGIGLLKAASAGDIAQIKAYLADGADINVLTGFPGMETTPLGMASSNGNLEVVKILVGNGANVNKPGFANCPPLFEAATNGHTDVVEYLIKNGADVNQKIPAKLGGTILRQMNGKHPDIIQLLKSAGARE